MYPIDFAIGQVYQKAERERERERERVHMNRKINNSLAVFLSMLTVTTCDHKMINSLNVTILIVLLDTNNIVHGRILWLLIIVFIY